MDSLVGFIGFMGGFLWLWISFSKVIDSVKGVEETIKNVTGDLGIIKQFDRVVSEIDRSNAELREVVSELKQLNLK